MSKTLRQILEEKKIKNCNVKIGSKEGSSFWYCGKAKLLYSEPILNEINLELIRQDKTLLKEWKYRYDHLDHIYENIIKQAKEDIRNGNKKVKDFNAYVKTLMDKKEKERKRLPIRIKDIKKDIEVHILNRKVEEIVKGISPDEHPCWVIYIKGYEKGKYWTIKEFESGEVEEEDED